MNPSVVAFSIRVRTFARSNPEIPAYSVHDIVRIGQSKKKLEYFMDERIFVIDDVPDDYKLGDAQELQVRAHKKQQPIIDHDAIAEVLRAYTFPLHFFDYETFSPAVPAFDGYSPYKRIPFQFSLHTLRDPKSAPEHVEFLHLERSDPTRAVAELLDKQIDPKGSVIVWYAPFERGVFRLLRERWAGRIDLQASALVSTDLYDTPYNAALVDLVAEVGCRLGGITFRLSEEEDPAVLGARLDRLFALATQRGLDVDLHVDENGSPASATLAQVAEAVLRNNFQRQVVCGHCCSLSILSDEQAKRTIQLVREAGLIIVSLPMVNQYLQGRKPGATPTWRGVTQLRELKAAGVAVALASDNCRDPYHPFGDLDPLEVFASGAKIGHLDGAMEEWASAVTTIPAEVMGVSRFGAFKPGIAADFQIFNGRTFSELIARRQSDRLVIRNGAPIDTTLPDFRDLDGHIRENE